MFLIRQDKDDILIVKNGLLTDTSIANIALYDGNDWYTPLHPLLKGTKRAELLDKGVLKEKEIKIKWKQGLSKKQSTTMYKKQYNQEIKIIRSSVRHRYDGRYISNYEALAYVEKVIYKYLKERKTN